MKSRNSIASKSKLKLKLRFRSSRAITNESKSSTKSQYKRQGSSQRKSSSRVLTDKSQRSHKIKNLSFATLILKYLGKNGKHNQLEDEMNNVIKQKDQEIAALKVYREQIKLLKRGIYEKKGLKFHMQTLKSKISIQDKIHVQKKQLSTAIEELNVQNSCLLQYMNWIITESESKCTNLEEEKLMMQNNLQMENSFLSKNLNEEKEQNAKEIKRIRDEIMSFRIEIKAKQNQLQQLKAKIFTLHIKLNQRNKALLIHRQGSQMPRSKQKKTETGMKQIYLGNSFLTGQSEQIYNEEQEVKKIQVNLKNKEVKLEKIPKAQAQKTINKKQKVIQEISINNLMSLKVFSQSKIVGFEYRCKREDIKVKRIGRCTYDVENQFLSLINKRINSILAVYHGSDMIGIKIYYNEYSLTPNKSRYRFMTELNPEQQVISEYIP